MHCDGAPPRAWFCTYPCATDDDCGDAATCEVTRLGSGCVPAACRSFIVDAGVDASDARLDGADGGDANRAHDATTD